MKIFFIFIYIYIYIYIYTYIYVYISDKPILSKTQKETPKRSMLKI